MEVYGQLKVAGLERLTTDPTGLNLFAGRAWYRTDTKTYKVYDGAAVQEFVDLTSAQTLQNKIVQGLQITDFLEFTDAATPANPVAGKGRIYRKADGTFYTLDSTGAELPLGSGSGSGAKNYFEDTDANVDSTVGNWLTDDGAGSPSAGLSIALTAVAGELLEGINSLKITKDAADRDGHFVKVLSKTIDPSDRGRPNYGSFEFRPLAGYESSDLIWEVYDVTNATVLYSGVSDDLELLNSRGRFDWVTYLEENTEQVEFRLKVNGTDANAFDVVVDEFSFGPAALLNAPIVTEWQPYDLVIGADPGPAPAPGVGAVIQAYWRRVGDTMEINYSLRQTTGGSNGTGSFTFPIPPGYSIDYDKVNTAPGFGAQGAVGPFMASDNGTLYSGWVQTYTDNTLLCYAGNASQNPTIISSTYIGLAGANKRFSFTARVPIVGWGAGAVLDSNEFSQQTIQASAKGTDGAIIATSAFGVVIFPITTYDSHGSYNSLTGEFKCARKGKLEVESVVSFNNNGAGVRAASIFVNGVEILQGPTIPSSGATSTDVSGKIPVEKGDIVTIRAFQNSGSNLALNSGVIFSSVSFSYEADFSLLGVVRNEQYLAAKVTSAPGTTAADTYVDSNAEITLTPGVWDIGHACSLFMTWVSGVTFNYATAIIRKADNTEVINNTQTTVGAQMNSSIPLSMFQGSAQERITVTETTTYKLSYRSSSPSSTVQVTVSGESFTGAISDPDSASFIWARRVK